MARFKSSIFNGSKLRPCGKIDMFQSVATLENHHTYFLYACRNRNLFQSIEVTKSIISDTGDTILYNDRSDFITYTFPWPIPSIYTHTTTPANGECVCTWVVIIICTCSTSATKLSPRTLSRH